MSAKAMPKASAAEVEAIEKNHFKAVAHALKNAFLADVGALKNF